ncbi:MAG: hypothetical protein ACXWZZ_11280 [Solirubrobacteraceae bacterium]
MTLRATILALCLAVVVGLTGAALAPDRREHDGRAAPAVAAAPSAPADAGGRPPAAELQGVSEAARRLDAVRTVKLFCDLVSSRRLWRAAALFATPRVWPRRELRAVRRLDFHSARDRLAPDPHSLVVIARVYASGGPASPVHGGDTTLYFTLGRVGSTTGGWLIAAVTTSP